MMNLSKRLKLLLHMMAFAMVFMLGFPLQSVFALSFGNPPRDIGDDLCIVATKWDNDNNVIKIFPKTQKWFEPGIIEVPYGFSSSPIDANDPLRPAYDFDADFCFFRLIPIPEDKQIKPNESQLVYYIFNKKTHELSGPLSLQEFEQQTTPPIREFSWKPIEITHKEASDKTAYIIIMSVVTIFVFYIFLPALILYFVCRLIFRGIKSIWLEASNAEEQ